VSTWDPRIYPPNLKNDCILLHFFFLKIVKWIGTYIQKNTILLSSYSFFMSQMHNFFCVSPKIFINCTVFAKFASHFFGRAWTCNLVPFHMESWHFFLVSEDTFSLFLRYFLSNLGPKVAWMFCFWASNFLPILIWNWSNLWMRNKKI